ncbi:MAG: Gfo/Idh/MocA family oxidoreductase [Verrucomicrobia bacterium]|jgi:predicted dehydrogenase|nr:Gfo/Idh/MocA family oxidoreductase [Verrucomicrobiota bacterium]MBT4275293.1 Gfo/Idh/MocA family oxidoreductase [Verrucomicrobiota bacterium]MBT5063443.1 Gfo/Idh/MocA family oxidoreductase [Verrucomicrobiota bacterium]MBT5480015.1 Gfo/Idh/MocA family oxidoreductase [Verrucomicrobiota bacterium]MBT6239220.1 Gfo/Idh/MocA family oxidoreductase [Verrucomicrobiota bacterium]
MRKHLKFTRRSFLGSLPAVAASIQIVPRHILGGQGVLSPNETPTKAVIGVGGMGRGHLKNINPGAKLVAVCDVDKGHLKTALDQSGGDVKGYHDFRDVLSRKDVDIVHIPTPPHWHALISIAAAEAGKDIWCEKPMTRTIYEGEKVVEAVQRNKRIFRLNTWFRFRSGFYGMGTTVEPIKKAVQSGMLGWPLKVTLNQATGFNWKHGWSGRTDLTPQPVPEALDYDFWLGPAPFKPYHPHRVHATFRGYWDYDGGGLGDMGQHYIDPTQYIMGKDHESPVEIEADTDPQDKDAVTAWRWIRFKYADGCEILLDGENKLKDAAYIEGPNGKLFKGFKSDIPDFEKKLAQFPDPEPQVTDFLEAVRERKPFALNDQNGHRSCTIVNLGKIALRTGRVLRFDNKTQRIINDADANSYIKQPMRAPWVI